MKRALLICCIAALLCMTVLAAPAAAEMGGLADTAWPKYLGDPNNTGQSPYTGPQISNDIWTYATGNSIRSSPAIGDNGTIYIGSYDKNLYALNADGTLKWRHTTGNQIVGSAALGAEETVYIGRNDNNL